MGTEVRDLERRHAVALRVEAVQGPLDLVPVRDAADVVGAGLGLVDGVDLDLDGAAPAPARFVEAAVHEESMEPGVEPVRVTKPGQVPPGPHQRVLDRVARELRVPKDEARGRVEAGSQRRGSTAKAS